MIDAGCENWYFVEIARRGFLGCVFKLNDECPERIKIIKKKSYTNKNY